jgi:hypothetical protein
LIGIEQAFLAGVFFPKGSQYSLILLSQIYLLIVAKVPHLSTSTQLPAPLRNLHLKLPTTMDEVVSPRQLDACKFRTAITYFLCDCDLSCEVMDKDSFRELLEICNPQSNYLATTKYTISDHLEEVFSFHQDVLQKKLSGIGSGVAYSLDTWNTPNFTSFMSITAHMIDEHFEWVHVVLRVRHIEGIFFL